MIEKITPDNQFEIANPSINLSVNNSIKNQIIVQTSPKVIKFIGKVIILKRAPKVAFTRDKARATRIATHKLSTATPGVRYEATNTAIPDIKRFNKNFVIYQQ